MHRCFVFPGQGSQVVGMGKVFYDNFSVAKDVFNEVDDALNFKLSDIIFSGTDTELGMTENTQPALMTVSVATARVLEQQCGKKISDIASFVAGHSLGEYSALCASGVIGLSDTARILKLRGSAMQKAVPAGIGGMVAVLGLGLEDIKKLTDSASNEQHKCWIANDNITGQIVLSGHIQAIDKVVEIAKDFGAKRALKLPVSAPFHCELMEYAKNVMAEALQEINFSSTSLDIITNVTAKPQNDVDIIRQGLVEQVCGSVRWRETVDTMGELKINELIECGAGKVLAGMVKRIEGIEATSLNTPQDIEDFIGQL